MNPKFIDNSQKTHFATWLAQQKLKVQWTYSLYINNPHNRNYYYDPENLKKYCPKHEISLREVG